MSSRDRKAQGRLAVDALRRFPDVPKQTLAKYLIAQHGAAFDFSVENARSAIRYYTGAQGDMHRSQLRELLPHTTLPKSLSVKREAHKLSAGTWLVLSDVHVPYHSEQALSKAVEYGRDSGVTGVLLNGDFQDCASISKFPVEHRDFLREVELTIDALDWLRQALPDAQIVWKPGNHEDRLVNYYMAKAPELVGLPTSDLETVLSLEKRGIAYLQRKQKVMAGKLPILHGHELMGGSTAVNPARWLQLKAKGCAACGHFHRTSDHNETTIKAELLATWSSGCLCELNPMYNPECNSWNWGFMVVNVGADGMYEVENKRILPDGKRVV